MNRLPRIVDRLLLAVGATLLVGVAVALTHRALSARAALAEFDQAQAALSQTPSNPASAPRVERMTVEDQADFTLWSEKRVREYRASLLIKKDLPLAVLEISKLKLRVAVFEGTDDLVLNRGVGWIEGTARPGDPGNGNIGLAGHRDGFFRGFKDIALGDEVALSTLGVVSIYAVDSTEIVDPSEVSVLRPRGAPSLTLVTCYPFYFIGNAPQRFIVHATLKRQVEPTRH